MKEKIKLRKMVILLCACLFLSLFICQNGNAKMTGSLVSVNLSLENEPKIDGIAILKLSIIAPENLDLNKTSIGCYIPLGLNLIDDIKFVISDDISQEASEKWGKLIIFYSGPMKKGEKKEFIFKIRIPDEKKYRIGVYGSDEEIEIDLGDPEPPEWSSQDGERASIKDGKRYILVRGVKQLEGDRVSNLEIPEDSFPPLRTELRIRTKDRPYIKLSYNPKEIPLRYLVYSEGEANDVEVTVELPDGLELINDPDYETVAEEKNGQKFTKVTLFQGPMRFKESKAFYFKVRSDKEELFKLRAQIKIKTIDNRELIKEDYQDINLGRVLY